jgi:hypothetical protein
MAVLSTLGGPTTTARAVTCTPTGFSGLTAALVNPPGTVSGNIDATGCDIGVYYNTGKGRVSGADIHGALWYGVMVHGDVGDPLVDVMDSTIHHIGDNPLNGNQRGVAIYYRAFLTGSAKGKIWNNTLHTYQKGGIVANGKGTDVSVRGNTVTGQGPVSYIAQNGIQIGYGATASVKQNMVTGHSYTGSSTVSGGIIVVGGPGNGPCPESLPCLYTTGTQIDGNTVIGNDIGIFLTNLASDGSAPTSKTNVKAVNNVISNGALTNNYGGFGYQAGVSDVGNNDKIIANSISGAGYDPSCAGYCVHVDADVSFTNKPKVHANR